MARVEKKEAPQEGGYQRKLYTGVALMQVVMINPTLSELVEEGYVNQKSVDEEKVKEPEYLESDGRYRIELYLESATPFKGETVRARHSIYVSDSYYTNKDGNYLYINNLGSFIGADKYKALPESAQYDYREAKVGEKEMAELLRSWCNLKKGEDLPLVHWRELSQGNLTSLLSIAEGPKSGFMKVLLGVKTTDEGKRYQVVYGKKFERHYTKDYSYLHKDLVGSKEFSSSSSVIEYGVNMLTYHPSDFDLAEYQPIKLEADKPGETKERVREHENAAVAEAVADNSGSTDDDLPF